MKSIIQLSSVITLGCMLPLSAQVTKSVETTTHTTGAPVTKTTETTETRRSGSGAVTETTTTTTHIFNPEARTKVVTYFDQYKTSPHGLPPGFSKVRVTEIPVEWRTTRIAPGVVVTEKQRPYLVSAPAELVSVLPAPAEGVRYYVAGSNVVSVDESYRIVDSVQIPSIKYSEEEDEIEIESKDGKKTTKVEVDKDDGEVEIEENEED